MIINIVKQKKVTKRQYYQTIKLCYVTSLKELERKSIFLDLPYTVK